MDWSEILLKFIKPELLILVPILWYLGTLLKKSPGVNDWKIPFILLIVSIALATPYVLLVGGATPTNLWLGILQGLAIAVFQGGLYQYKQQLTEKK